MLKYATSLNDLRDEPSKRLEKLTGNRAGQYNLRIWFEWRDGDAYLVEILDLHKEQKWQR